MTADDTVDPAIAEGTDRRTALKKAAIAAGVVAWTTPAVQAVTARPAFAQTVTACAPAFCRIQAFLTGPNCKQCPEVPALPSCCSGNTYFLQLKATCGASCPGDATVAVIDDRGRHEAWQLQERPFPRRCLQELDGHDHLGERDMSRRQRLHDHQSGRPDHVHRLRATVPTAELSTSDVIEDELIEHAP